MVPVRLLRGAFVAVLALGLSAAVLPDANSDTAPALTPDVTSLVTVDTPTWEDRQRLAALGLDLTEHAGHDFVEIVLHGAGDVERLTEAGFTWTVRIPDLAARGEEIAALDAAFAAANPRTELPSGRNGYRTLADYEAELQGLAQGLPHLVRLIELPHTSLEGRTIYGIEIASDPAASDGRPTFAMFGLHHAREWPSGEHTMEFAHELLQGYGTDPRIKRLVDSVRTIIVPVVNPDGFHQSRTWGERVDLRETDDGGSVTILGTPGNAYKRKNCRLEGADTTPPGVCESPSPGGYALGVDLNRNYGGLWGGAGASDVFADPTYRGAGPFSEPETQNIRELVASRHVTTLITNHTFSNLILRPPGVRAAGTTIDEPAMRELGARMAEQNGYRNIHGWQLYDTTGTTEDWSYNATAGYGYTFEIGPDEFHPPFEQVVEEYRGDPGTEFEGKGNREAYLLALETAADTEHHAVITGAAPEGAVLRLHKAFETTTTTGEPIEDVLESTMTVGPGSRFTWHVNPSTRPEVMEHRVELLQDEPVREEVTEEVTAGWVVGDRVEVPFAVTEPDAAALQVNLDWDTPDDLDLYVYYVTPTGERAEVGVSGELLDKEEALIPKPAVGDYLLVAENFASVAPTVRFTAGVYQADGSEVVKEGGIVEAYRLTCETPAGAVLQTLDVVVDRGRTQRVDLGACAEPLRAARR